MTARPVLVFTAAVLCLCLVLALSGCGDGADTPASTTTQVQPAQGDASVSTTLMPPTTSAVAFTTTEREPTTTERLTTTSERLTTTTEQLTTTTTSEAPVKTSVTVPSGWTVFESDSLSLALPGSFEGGPPTDADVQAVVEAVVALNPSMAGLEEAMQSGLFLLMIFGEPDAQGRLPNIMAVREVVPSSISMERYVKAGTPPGSELTMESITNDSARVVCRSPVWEGSELTSLQYYAMERVGARVYTVVYTFAGDYDEAMDSVFRASAKTIAIRE